ncbi:MAG: prolipoprotein diacylglyceryl transferase, partial [Candidatus Dadabacteria bacterium]|nr:prolipoprotein diacylglyceryl transferase [Candidatus Dadabacteria bacterium]
TAAAAYGLRWHHPVGIIADLTAPAMLIVQTIGRLGDIVNGEHCAKAADFFLSFVWTNPASDARFCDNGVGVAIQPVIAYEMVWNLLALILVWRLRGKIRPAGMLFALYLALYAVGRFAISFAREDKVWTQIGALGLQEAHYIALLVLAITVPLLIIKARPAKGVEAELAALQGQAVPLGPSVLLDIFNVDDMIGAVHGCISLEVCEWMHPTFPRASRSNRPGNRTCR